MTEDLMEGVALSAPEEQKCCCSQGENQAASQTADQMEGDAPSAPAAGDQTQSQAARCGQKGTWQPKVVAFLCNWCSYAGADLAGISRIQYPPNIRIIRVPCSGRINPVFILKALQAGADGVLISGCHPGDCHYVSGNYYARRKFEVFDRLLDYIGLEPGRVFFSWVSAAEGENFGRLIKHVVDEVEKLGPASKLVKTLF